MSKLQYTVSYEYNVLMVTGNDPLSWFWNKFVPLKVILGVGTGFRRREFGEMIGVKYSRPDMWKMQH